MITRILLLVMALSVSAFAQAPPIEPGVSQELAKWRAAHYSNVRYKLNLTLEKMSPVLKGTIEIRLQYAAEACAECPPRYIVLDWRKIRGHEEKSTISNVTINGRSADTLVRMSVASTRTGTGDDQSSNEKDILAGGTGDADKSVRAPFEERDEHLIFSDGVEMGENVIKLDFTSPILTSGSAITRYLDKEDGSEYLYSLFVPSDASTAFPVFDQPDIKARFELDLYLPNSEWKAISNSSGRHWIENCSGCPPNRNVFTFPETKPVSTYVFAFAAGPFEKVEAQGGNPSSSEGVSSPASKNTLPTGRVSASNLGGSGPGIQPPATAGGTDIGTSIYVRKSQAEKFKPHAAEVFRLNREAIRYFEEYFNYKFPWPKYDLVLIPEFPFGGMEHAGATFLRESSIIFPQEPTKNDHISRALLMFHEASHQWFGDTVTMRWFDDLWLKEGFATFTAYKAMEKIMPEMNSWKVFYERVKQAAYQTDSTRGTTAIYQPIANLSAAKSAYGNIVYNKAPAFLRQAEFYLGEDKFQSAVRAFLKKHEFGNAGWEDLVKEFEGASG
ncbi:MAG TPA: M1 family aminopeptidase, partial [Pyrinomonadaceae bacterium]